MPERPLLIFPSFERVQPPRIQMMPRGVHKPDSQRQGERLSPVFAELQSACDTRRMELQATTIGMDPEQVLVFETVGSVDDFVLAVKRITGFEWMGEVDVDDLTPDRDFFLEGREDHSLSGRLYLVMTNQQAMNQLLSLWGEFTSHPELAFQRGLGRFKELFKCLRSVRRWDVQDRLLDTQLLENWSRNLSDNPEEPVRFEAELWFRGQEQKQIASQADISRQVRELGGRVLSQCILPEIAYHGLLGELPVEAIRAVAESQSIQSILTSPIEGIVRSESIMFLRPVGQMSAGKEPIEGDFSQHTRLGQPLPSGNAVVALLDGAPVQHHQMLDGRLMLDDPDDYQSDYQANERIHGTAMASLIVHGDLSESGPALTTPLYLRPILQPDHRARGFNIGIPEVIPETVLAVDLIHRAVKRIFEGEGGDSKPTASSVRIINLSIGDFARQFDRIMSPLSRLIDWLSHRYGVLFVVSAGNHSGRIELGMDRLTFESLTPKEREKELVRHLQADAGNRRLRPPAESINALTVGSAHLDSSTVENVGQRVEPFTIPLPSPFSAFGSGYRRAIKPDLLFAGGRQWYREPLVSSNPLLIEPHHFRKPPGLQVASPGLQPGSLDATEFMCGTSHATALISRAAAGCFSTLQEVFSEFGLDIDREAHVAPLLKAMLVHGCSWGEMGERLVEILRTTHNSRELRSWIGRWMGYGLPDIQRVVECTAQRATILGYGSLNHDEGHVYNLPLPPSLSAQTQVRRLTVSLAWLTPVHSNTQKYRAARLWFDSKHDLTDKRQNADWQAVRRGTVQHEVFEGEKAIPFTDGESLKIQVNCLKDAGAFTSPVPYGIAVTLEVAEGINIAIYDEIKARIITRVQIQQQIAGQ